MATSMDEKWSIDKLDASNWMTWKFQMRHLLLAKGLWGHVDATEVLAEGANEQNTASFRLKSQRAFSSIVMAVSTSQLYLVTSCEGPKEAWDALRNHFERETLANKLFLKKQYFRSEMKEGTSIDSHLKNMKEITDKLAAIGAAISEEDQVVTLLGSLPPRYSTLVTALETRVDQVSLKFVQQALINEEQKQLGQLGYGHSGMSGGETDSVLVGAYKKGKPLNQVRCFGCSGIGHFIRDCPRRKKTDNYMPTYKAKTAEENNSASDSDGAFNTALHSEEATQMGTWLIDSGASAHMTHDRNLLLNYHEFEKHSKVGLGDGSTVEAVGVGNVCVRMVFTGIESKKAVLYDVLYVPKLRCNLFSVRAAAGKGNMLQFGHTRCWIWDKNRKLRGMGSLVDKLYQLDCEAVPREHASVATMQRNDIDLWHQRLGHLNGPQVKEMILQEVVSGAKISKKN